MSDPADESRPVVRTFVETLNAGTLGVLGASFVDDFGIDDVDQRTVTALLDVERDYQQAFLDYQRVFPDSHEEVLAMTTNETDVSWQLLVTNTHESEHDTVAPTGASFEVSPPAVRSHRRRDQRPSRNGERPGGSR